MNIFLSNKVIVLVGHSFQNFYESKIYYYDNISLIQERDLQVRFKVIRYIKGLLFTFIGICFFSVKQTNISNKNTFSNITFQQYLNINLNKTNLKEIK